MAKRRKVGNLLALAILAQLDSMRPMHPYELATVLRRTGKEHDMAIK
jgi:DNA-binding PadR family transcriptional regulator